MKPEIAKLWVEALESGKYKRGKSALRSKGQEGKPDEFCCLGVLCDLYAKQMKKGFHYGADENNAYPRQTVLNWAGIKMTDTEGSPYYHYNGKRYHFANLNDEQNLSFKKIAKRIRSHQEII